MGLIPGLAIITHLSHDLGKLHLLLATKKDNCIPFIDITGSGVGCLGSVPSSTTC